MRIFIQSARGGTESNGVALQSEVKEAVRLLDRNRMRTASADVFEESMVIVLERENDSRPAIQRQPDSPRYVRPTITAVLEIETIHSASIETERWRTCPCARGLSIAAGCAMLAEY
jgi:hypothetical protein